MVGWYDKYLLSKNEGFRLDEEGWTFGGKPNDPHAGILSNPLSHNFLLYTYIWFANYSI